MRTAGKGALNYDPTRLANLGGLSLTWDISLFVSSLKILNWMVNLFWGGGGGGVN